MKEVKEHYVTKLQGEKKDLVAAVEAVVIFHRSLDKFENAAFRGDALAEVNRCRDIWKEKLEKVKPYLEEK